METNFGEKYKVLGGNIVKLALCVLVYLIFGVVLIGVVNPAVLASIFESFGVNDIVNTSSPLLPDYLQYILMVTCAGLFLAAIYCILSIFMNKFVMYENAFVIKRPFRAKTLNVADIESISAVRQTNRYGLIPVSVVDMFTFYTQDQSGKNVSTVVKSGHYLGLKKAMIAYDEKYSRGWF